jgi:hypothetical protein
MNINVKIVTHIPNKETTKNTHVSFTQMWLLFSMFSPVLPVFFAYSVLKQIPAIVSLHSSVCLFKTGSLPHVTKMPSHPTN